jgi:hypothetical protein
MQLRYHSRRPVTFAKCLLLRLLLFDVPKWKIVTLTLLISMTAHAQLTSGIVEGTVIGANGQPSAGVAITATGGAGLSASVSSDARGRFTMVLPSGRYRIGEAEVFVAPLRITNITMRITTGITTGITTRVNLTAGTAISAHAPRFPDPFTIQGIILRRDAAIVTNPFDFTGLGDSALPIFSDRAMSWTATEFKLNGMDATDPYQPGRPLLLPDVEAIKDLTVRSGFSQTTSSAYASEIGVFADEPGPAWHASFSTADSGSLFSWSNLPANHGIVEQPQFFRWFTRDGAQAGGPIAPWADVFAAIAGEWSSQTVPLAAPGTNQDLRLLYGTARARLRAGAKDRFDTLYSGSRRDLSNFATPAGVESYLGRPDSPSFILPIGFAGQSAADSFDQLQLGWTHIASGLIEVRYAYSTAHLDTPAAANGLSTVELLDGAVTGAPPISNSAARTRQAIEGNWQPASTRHHFIADAGWTNANARNRISAPSNMNLITADGAPAFVVDLNTPLESIETVRSFTAYAADHINIAESLSVDLGALADFSRGSVPGQGNLIGWNSLSPRAGFAWQAPHTRGLVLRGSYFRVEAPLAARDLDFGNLNSLSGSEYQWLGGTAPIQTGELLMRFGGEYSSISPSLGRPYADEFNVGAQYPVMRAVSLSVNLYRRDDKNRLAAIDTGVPFSAYTPVPFFDPLAQQNITVYAQNPATFGQDRYLLTNPPDLRFETSGIVTALETFWRGVAFRASFVADSGWGPTNPGDSPVENDPGIVGALYANPNTLINASGRNYFDRGFAGKMQASYRLPWRIELSSSAIYFDGLPFAQQLLVTGLPQGPIVIGTTIRGNPGDGNRAEYVIDWNLRAQREFRLHFGKITGAVDVLNVTNAGQKIQESDLSGPNFLERLPVAIQEPRSLRFVIRYEF